MQIPGDRPAPAVLYPAESKPRRPGKTTAPRGPAPGPRRVRHSGRRVPYDALVATERAHFPVGWSFISLGESPRLGRTAVRPAVAPCRFDVSTERPRRSLVPFEPSARPWDISGSPPLTVGIVSTFPPTACGIATFSAALAGGLVAHGAQVRVVRVSDGSQFV